MQSNGQMVDEMKVRGHYFAAGALAQAFGYDRGSYGTHFGTRDDLERSRDAFYRGWDAAAEEYARD